MIEAEKPKEPHPPRSTQDLLLLIAAIGAMILSIMASGGVIVSGWINSSRIESQAVELSEKSDEKLEVIHKQTNSNLTGLNDRLDKAYTKIEKLEQLLSEEKDP